ncbi:MAG: arsenate reductase ArsC [Ignavibacteria bacterium]|nr:arsenate reductase ArsC [Ignavibacteria bacterium]
MKRILVLCTGNSCRSQMAEAFLRSFDRRLEVVSAGTKPAAAVHPKATEVMREVGIDLSHHKPKLVDKYLNDSFDYVVTVCDHAKETCPVFTGKVRYRLHIGFEDPAEARGTPGDVISVFRSVRDEIKHSFYNLYSESILPALEGNEA